MSLPFFRKKQDRSLGVDIGTSSVKIVELSRGGGKLELTNYGEYAGKDGATLHSSAIRISPDKTADIIKRILSEAKIETTNATIAIPIFSGFSAVISLPAMSDAELEQAVTFEAKKYIPLPLSEVQFEWMKLISNSPNSPNSPNNAEGISVLIVAVTNEVINKYRQIAQLSGLGLLALELDSFSLARALASPQISADSKLITADSGISNLIIDIGSRNTVLTVVENGWPTFTRSLDVSGYQFTKMLSSSLGIDFGRAEDLKRKGGVDAGVEVIVPLLDSIFLEAKRIVKEYGERKKTQVGRIVLSGGSAQMPGVLEYAARAIGKQAVIGFPFNGIIYPKELDKTLRGMGPSFSVAVGAAMREFV